MKNRIVPWLLLVPMLFVMGIFLFGLLGGIVQGFGVIPAFGLTEPTLKYYREALRNPDFLSSIGVSLYIAVTASFTATVCAVILSYSLVTLGKTRGILYSVIKIPIFLPWMVTGLLMTNMFAGGGWLARLFHALGLSGLENAVSRVLYQPNHLGVILAFVWACTPFMCFFIITVMDNLSGTFVEAAHNLGANNWQTFWNITFPLCLPTIRNMFLIVLLSCFGSYEIPLLLGMTVPRALPVEIYYQYNHFDLRHRPYAMALNTVMLLLSLLLAGAGYRLFGGWKRKKHERKGGGNEAP